MPLVKYHLSHYHKIAMAGFVHLHVHSDYSLTDAAVSVKSLADRAEELGMSHLALTDHGNMFGIMEFISACQNRKKPINPIVGCEVYVSSGSHTERNEKNKRYHLILLASNREGYFNLVKLCSIAYTEGFYHKPRVDDELLEKYHGGLIALSACVSGEIPRLIRSGKIDEAEQKAVYYSKLFGKDEKGNPNFYLEIQDHGIPAEVLKSSYSQRDINREIAAISSRTGIPLAATNDVHYLNRDDFIAHDVLLCIGTAKFRSDEKRTKKYYGDQFYFKSADEMTALFPDYPGAIANTVLIAERCNADIPKITTHDLPAYLPECELPEGFTSRDEYLRHLAQEGLAKRYAKEKEAGGIPWRQIQERCEYELDVIIKMGFTSYFLIVADFIDWARKNNIPVGPGRGSGAGSIVAYTQYITNIDPIKYDLLFERFLNPERVSMPDFDIDFANEGRDEVIKYVTEKYGEKKVAQIITFGTMGAKAVIKDVARTLSISIDESERIAKLIPFQPGITLEEAISEEPRLKEIEKDPRYTELFSLARKLEGLNRHSSLHASGVVIGKADLQDIVPLFKDTKTGAIATQYDMNHMEKCGLIKMDFLGLKTLDVIKQTEELIRRRGGKYSNFNAENVPENDKQTFKMLGEGQSFEVFQFESDGMRDVLKRTKPGKIEDLIALNALYRPGPMANIPRFIDSKNGTKEISYPDPSLEDILKETYGVIVYQEQVMQVAQIVAGFTLGHADELRRAMGKKIMEKMIKEKEQFITGAKERGYSEKKADNIFELLIPFAGYGFNKSHAAAYSVLAYRTAYLKANFPAEFMAANLTNEIHSGNKDKLSECINETRKMGIAIDPPDVNRSEKLFTIVEGRIVFGLLGIKGIGEAPADEIVRCRLLTASPNAGSQKDSEERPGYRDFMDFLDKVNIKLVGKAVIEKLIQTGAFDCFKIKRENLLGNLEKVIEFSQRRKEDLLSGQTDLFGDTAEKSDAGFTFEDFPEISRNDKLKTEMQLIGFYLSGHPMDNYRQLWERSDKIYLKELTQDGSVETGIKILVGIVKNIKPINSKSGKMAYVTIADYNGEMEMTFFPRLWEGVGNRVRLDEIAIIKGKIDYQKDRDKYSFIAEEWIDISNAETVIADEEEARRKMEAFRNVWLYMADLKSGGYEKAKRGNYTIVGQLINIRENEDVYGKNYAFGTLHDFEGDIELVFFSKVWEESRNNLGRGEFVALKGSIDPENDQRQDRKPSFKVSSVADIAALSRAANRKAKAGEEPAVPPTSRNQKEKPDDTPVNAKDANPPPEIHIRLDNNIMGNKDDLLSLRKYLSDNTGLCPVFIHVGEKIIRADSGLSMEAPEEDLGILETFPLVEQVWILPPRG